MSPLDRMDQLLADAEGVAARKVPLAEFKDILRSAGEPGLASHLSRLSKGRNVAAHPDLGLEKAALAVLASSAGARDAQEGVHEGDYDPENNFHAEKTGPLQAGVGLAGRRLQGHPSGTWRLQPCCIVY